MASANAAAERLCDPASNVSAHYLIARDGELLQLVDEDRRAWHAGAGEWAGHDDINSRSIGIELDNDGRAPFAAALMDRLEGLLASIMARHAIRPEGVIGHSDMAPGRKCDPGSRFDWQRLERQGLAEPRGRGPAHETGAPATFRERARAAGYSAPVDDATLLAAIRLRFRPWGRGPLAPEDVAALPSAR